MLRRLWGKAFLFSDKEIRASIWAQYLSFLSAIWGEEPLLDDCSFQPVRVTQIWSPLFLPMYWLSNWSHRRLPRCLLDLQLSHLMYILPLCVCTYIYIYVHSTYNIASKNLKPPYSGIKINASLNITILNSSSFYITNDMFSLIKIINFMLFLSCSKMNVI